MRKRHINGLWFYPSGGGHEFMIAHSDGHTRWYKTTDTSRAQRIVDIVYENVQFGRRWIVFPGLEGWKAITR